VNWIESSASTLIAANTERMMSDPAVRSLNNPASVIARVPAAVIVPTHWFVSAAGCDAVATTRASPPGVSTSVSPLAAPVTPVPHST
jgi:hypothetical protein